MEVDKNNLNKHINSIHNNKVYPCSLCEYKASASQSLKHHMMSIHNQGDIKCQQCPESFEYRNAQNKLKRHMLFVHDFTPEKMNRPLFKATLRKLNDRKLYSYY